MPFLLRRKMIASLPTASGRRSARTQYKETMAEIGTSTVLFCMSAFVCVYSYHTFIESHDQPSGLTYSSARMLNATNATAVVAPKKAVIGPPNFPAYLVSPYENGGVIVYMIGMIYTFMGLAVVCDEFFVPALEVMIEKFDISEDVAGATLMAAGGSAPELTTSLIGTFLSVSDVGFGTIVGSAVFNVLFVIGMCAVFSKEILVLTWWPLFRDSTYYIMSLGLLALFFGGPTVESQYIIEAWEAIILFSAYLGYGAFLFCLSFFFFFFELIHSFFHFLTYMLLYLFATWLLLSSSSFFSSFIFFSF